MKYDYGVIHAIADCVDCGWHCESYKNAQALSAKHARKYKHTVKGEVANAFTYYGATA